RAADGSVVDVPRALSVPPRAPCITAQRVARFHPLVCPQLLATKEVIGQSALRADSSTSALFSRTGSLRGGCIRAAFDHLPLVMDYPVGRVPDAPHPHLSLTMRTAQRVPPRALLIPLPVGQPGNDLNGALDHAFHLGHSLANQHLELGECFRGLHAVIPDALEAFGHRVLHLCGSHNYVARMTQRKIPPHFRGQISPHSE